jgi:hypothetical protein
LTRSAKAAAEPKLSRKNNPSLMIKLPIFFFL